MLASIICTAKRIKLYTKHVFSMAVLDQEIMDLMWSCMSVFIRKTMLGIHWNAWGDCWVFVIEGFISKKNKQNKHLCDLISLSFLCSGEHCISQVPQCGDPDHQINPGTISSVNAVEFENSSALTSAGEYFRIFQKHCNECSDITIFYMVLHLKNSSVSMFN